MSDMWRGRYKSLTKALEDSLLAGYSRGLRSGGASTFYVQVVDSNLSRSHVRIEVEMAMIQQLRIYEIFENSKTAFHARFRDHAARIMRARYGFHIVAMWETRFGDRTEFAYLLEWPDEAVKTAAWSAFMADTEWSEIKRVTHAEHGLMVGKIEDRLLVPTDYSPAKGQSPLMAS